jgi:ubiquinone/menaquinone biosynthesis C-methylase UbiE
VSDWTDDYFERGYAQRWGVLQVTDQVRLEAGSLWTRCHFQPNDTVVDVGCGHGRHALALSERGARVVGLDASSSLTAHARQAARELRVAAHWVRGDMRCVPLWSGACDGVVMMDAIGFFDSEDDNLQTVREAARVLRPGGRLALKLVNGAPVVEGFRAVDQEERDGVAIAVSRTLSLAPPRMIERLSISGTRGTGRYERRQRLYRADEMSALLQAAGFADIVIASDAAGAAFEPRSSPAMWIVARARAR